MSYSYNMAVKYADLLIGAVLVPRARAPHLVSEELVKQMKPGSVILDIAVDQGGSIESIDRVTTHSDPTYVKHGVVHYAVAKFALTNVTLPYALEIANKGYLQAVRENEALAHGLNVINGFLVYEAVAKALNLEYATFTEAACGLAAE